MQILLWFSVLITSELWLGSVLYNYSSTRLSTSFRIPKVFTLTEMINHGKKCNKNVGTKILFIKKSLMVVDMPYKSYDTSNLSFKKCKKNN